MLVILFWYTQRTLPLTLLNFSTGMVFALTLLYQYCQWMMLLHFLFQLLSPFSICLYDTWIFFPDQRRYFLGNLPILQRIQMKKRNLKHYPTKKMQKCFRNTSTTVLLMLTYLQTFLLHTQRLIFL